MAMPWFILLAIISLVAFGSTKPISSPSDEEENVSPWVTKNTNDNFYLNAYFGMTVEKPEGWYSLPLDELTLLADKVKPQIDKLLDASDISQEKFIPIFAFNAFPPNTQNGQINANILALAQNGTNKGSIDDDCDIIRASESVEIPNMKNIHRSECRLDVVNGIKYAVQESTWNVQDTVIIKQIQFIRSTENGFVMSFTLTYTTEDDKNILMRCMNTVYFS